MQKSAVLIHTPLIEYIKHISEGEKLTQKSINLS